MTPRKPLIALNMTTLNQGGIMQRAVSFIENMPSLSNEFDWHLLISEKVQQELDQRNIPTTAPKQVFKKSPARNPAVRKKVIQAINKVSPDLVFTFGGPSYLQLTFPELMGVTEPWVTHGTREAYRSVPGWRNRWGLYLAAQYKLRWFRKAQHFIVQTTTAQRGLSRLTNRSGAPIHVIPNALAPWYQCNEPATLRKPEELLRIIYFAAPYSHKRHLCLPAICKAIEELGEQNFEIAITIDPTTLIAHQVAKSAEQLGVPNRIVNLGRIPVSDGLSVYQGAHICFVPSILETFSATYLEGMATRTPIVACDLDFARETCGDAAVYFDPVNMTDAAKKILNTANSPDRCLELTERGVQQLATFPSTKNQMILYRDVLRSTINNLNYANPS